MLLNWCQQPSFLTCWLATASPGRIHVSSISCDARASSSFILGLPSGTECWSFSWDLIAILDNKNKASFERLSLAWESKFSGIWTCWCRRPTSLRAWPRRWGRCRGRWPWVRPDGSDECRDSPRKPSRHSSPEIFFVVLRLAQAFAALHLRDT